LVKLISLHFYLQVKPLQLISKDIIVRFINKLSRVVQQAQKLKLMGGDAQLNKVTKTINASGFDKAVVKNRPQILARPLAVSKINQREI